MAKKLRGFVEYLDKRKLIGWALVEGDNAPLNLDVYHDGIKILSLSANVFREGLAKTKLHTTGYCGFEHFFEKPLESVKNVVVKYRDKEVQYAPILSTKINWKFQRSKSYKTKEGPLYYFIHIPKTAGTSFRLLLENNFKPINVMPSQRDIIKNGGVYPKFHQLKELLDTRSKQTRFVTGHYPYCLQSIFENEVIKMVFLRDPVDRVISNIFHMKNNDDSFKNLDVKYIYERGISHFSNLQTRHMIDNEFNNKMQFLDRNNLPGSLFSQAKFNINDCDFVGMTEYFEASVLLANKMFDLDLNPSKKVNVTKKKFEVSPELRNQIKKQNRMDTKLYKFAMQKFKYLCMLYDIPMKPKKN